MAVLMNLQLGKERLQGYEIGFRYEGVNKGFRRVQTGFDERTAERWNRKLRGRCGFDPFPYQIHVGKSDLLAGKIVILAWRS